MSATDPMVGRSIDGWLTQAVARSGAHGRVNLWPRHTVAPHDQGGQLRVLLTRLGDRPPGAPGS